MILTGGGLRKQLESDDNDLLREVGAEAYLRGVSPRRVEGFVEALGIASLSKSQVSELAAGLSEGGLSGGWPYPRHATSKIGRRRGSDLVIYIRRVVGCTDSRIRR